MADLVSGPVSVRVPASSANLGPGYDALGLALTLHDTVTAEVVEPGGGPVSVTVTGEGADTVPRDETHLVHRAMCQAFDRMQVPRPGVRLECANAIPHGRGLGSSSAAIVAGLTAARALVVDGETRLGDDALFGLAAELEGHPDNVAPAVYGGFTIAYAVGGHFRAVRLEVTSPVALTVFVPPEPLRTEVARGLLPPSVPHEDASFNAGRSALLVAALTGRPDRLLEATEDRLHQGYRAPAMPASAALVDALRSEGVAAVVSGAGPTVLALAPRHQADAVAARVPDGWQVLRPDVDREGARVL